MKVILAAISPTRSRAKSTPADTLTAEFLTRAGRYLPCTSQTFDSEASLFTWAERQAARTAPILILFDRTGKQLSSDQFAGQVGTLRDSGAQVFVLAIGPADGWSSEARARATHLISFGPITLPHELARAVLAEQLYRALTILAGHPYHSSH